MSLNKIFMFDIYFRISEQNLTIRHLNISPTQFSAFANKVSHLAT